ncbi:hypothetical protein KHP62_03165 [Rhodobacteraceae bacterium NNCM2]|nr:hypothetical protein [Coraliihabitans acroporae]
MPEVEEMRAERARRVLEAQRARDQRRADRARLAQQTGRADPPPLRHEKPARRPARRRIREDPITIGIFTFVFASTLVPLGALVIFG